jgi:enoyl-CoA hydratase
MDEKAFFADPHVSLGLVAADGGALTWPLLMGLQQAKEYLYLGGRISAEEAHRLGLANRVVPAGTSLDVALEIAAKLAALPPQALRETKAILNTPLQQRIDTAIAAALAAESRSFDTPEFQGNLAAFLGRAR